MKSLLFGSAVVALLLSGCGPAIEERFEDPPPAAADAVMSGFDSRPWQPNICWGSCERTPTIEPVGQICWLSGQQCQNGMLVCYYHCEPIEDEFTRG